MSLEAKTNISATALNMNEPTGIGGWLIIPVIGMVWVAFRIVINIQFIGERTLFYLNAMLNDFSFELILSFLPFLLTILYSLYAIFCLYKIFSKDIKTAFYMKVFYVLSIVLNFFMFFSFSGGYEVYFSFGISFIFSIIWFRYFSVSKRVKNTFTPHVADQKVVEVFS